jgi:hypothetical protein
MDQPASPALTVPELALEPWHRRIWRTYVTDVRAAANARAIVSRESDRKMVLVLVTAAVALTCNNFLSDGSHPAWLESLLRGLGLGGTARRLHHAMLVSSHREWNQLGFWAVVMVTTYVVPPVLLIRLVFRERVRDYGLRVRGIGRHVRTYLALYAIAAPLIFAVSFTAAFQERYPFYHPPVAHSLWPYLYAWWALYWLQFCALEFFFRGFMVHGLAPRLGYAAIFAAIAGGIALGTLSLKTRSIWWGAAIHISIALTMDVCALWHAGRIF